MTSTTFSRPLPASVPVIAPSILSADFGDLIESIKTIPDAPWLHVDIMDGHFVPNLSFGPDIARTVYDNIDIPLDFHLMIEEPEKWIERYVDAGAASITFHVEATEDPVAVAKKLHELGCRASFSIKPGTPIEPYLKDLEHFDMVLVMSVEPGFGGQSFMPEVLDKVRTLRNEIDQRGLDTLIEIDGGISLKTIAQAAEAGVDVFVAGSAVFGAENPNAMIGELASAAAAARK